MDETHIDEDLLNAAARMLFGNKGANKLRRTYGVLSDVAEGAFRQGFEAGLNEGAQVSQFRQFLCEEADKRTAEDDLMDENVRPAHVIATSDPEDFRTSHEAKLDAEYRADAAQITMDSLWGGGPLTNLDTKVSHR